MRDIDLEPVGDTAYASPPPAGLPVDTTLVDPSFTDTKAYAMPSLGGEFGPGRVPVLSGPADGGAALLAGEEPEEEPPAGDPPVQVTAVTLTNGNASFGVSGQAQADAVAHIRYVICGDLRSTSINILSGATAAMIANAIRAALRAMGDLWVSGAGGQITAHSLVSKNPITDFEVSIERD